MKNSKYQKVSIKNGSEKHSSLLQKVVNNDLKCFSFWFC